MKMISNLKIGVRLALAFVIILALSLATGIYATSQLAKVQSNVTDLATNWMVSTRSLGDFDNKVNGHRRMESRLVIANASDEVADAEKQITRFETEADKAWKAYAPTIASDEEKQLANDIQAKLNRYYSFTPKLIQLAKDGSPELKVFYSKESRTSFAELQAAIAKDLALQDRGADKA